MNILPEDILKSLNQDNLIALASEKFGFQGRWVEIENPYLEKSQIIIQYQVKERRANLTLILYMFWRKINIRSVYPPALKKLAYKFGHPEIDAHNNILLPTSYGIDISNLNSEQIARLIILEAERKIIEVWSTRVSEVRIEIKNHIKKTVSAIRPLGRGVLSNIDEFNPKEGYVTLKNGLLIQPCFDKKDSYKISMNCSKSELEKLTRRLGDEK